MNADEGRRAAWEFATPILDAMARGRVSRRPDDLHFGCWGPKEADRLTEGCNVGWREP